MRVGRLSVVASLVCVGACGEGQAPESTVVRDSLGVRMVENRSPGQLPTTVVADEPIYRIGWEVGGPTFQDVTAGGLLSDAAAAVFEEGSHTLLVIAPDGSQMMQVGRDGEGPGEFRYGQAVEVGPGDTIVVYDSRLRRLSTFERSGRFAGSGQWDRQGNVYRQPSTVTSSNHLVWVPNSYALPNQMGHGTEWLFGSVLLSDMLGSQVDTLASLPMLELRMEGDRILRDPFMRWGVWAGLPSGFAWGRNDVAEVRWYSDAGRLKQVARWAAEMRAVDDEAWLAYSRAYVAQAASRSRDVSEEQVEAHLVEARRGASSTLPLFSSLHAWPSGELWLGGYAMLGSPPLEYLVIGADGVAKRLVTFPRPLRILDMREGRVLGVEYDEWDVPAVVVYDIATKTAA